MDPKIESSLRAIADLCIQKAAHPRPVSLAEEVEKAPVEIDPDDDTEVEIEEQTGVEKSILVSIAKAVEEEHTVTGVVLQPEVVDGHGDIMSADVIKETAFKFLAGFNKTTKLGVQHTIFKAGQLELVESYIAPMDMVIGSKTVKAGSWIMTMRVLDMKLWKKIKDGEITGFSIGGIAKVIPVAA